MAAQFNIKDPVLIERARYLAKRNGQPVTTTLRNLVDREWEAEEKHRRQKLIELDAIMEEVRATMPSTLRGMTAEEIGNSLYDDEERDGFAR